MATLSAVIPDHVPQERVREFDVYHVMPGERDMLASAAKARANFPKVFYTPLNGGHWIVAGYKEALACGRDTDTFSSFPYAIPAYENEQTLYPIHLNPPVHTKWRAVFNKVFTPTAAVRLREKIRTTAAKLIEDVKGQGGCDYVQSFSELLPVSVFLQLMGLPVERLHEYRTVVKTYLADPDFNAKLRAGQWITSELTAALIEKKANPQDDVMTAFVQTEIDGHPVSLDDAVKMSMMIFVAGLDTVTISLSYATRYLAENQELQAKVRADPSLIPGLVEELLRRFSPAQPGRSVANDVELDGVTLKKGDRVFVMLAAANLDGDMFESPEDVRLDRERLPHIAFNVGPHRCVGMHLARVELQIGYEEWLKRIPQFRIGDQGLTPSGGHVFSFDRLNLRWD